MLVPAPGRFSMTNVWPSRSVSHCPIRREAADQTHRPARIGVRERTASNGGRGDSARRQLEKLPAEKVHDNAPGQCKRSMQNSRATPRSQNQRKGAMIVLDAYDPCWWRQMVWFSA